MKEPYIFTYVGDGNNGTLESFFAKIRDLQWAAEWAGIKPVFIIEAGDGIMELKMYHPDKVFIKDE